MRQYVNSQSDEASFHVKPFCFCFGLRFFFFLLFWISRERHFFLNKNKSRDIHLQQCHIDIESQQKKKKIQQKAIPKILQSFRGETSWWKNETAIHLAIALLHIFVVIVVLFIRMPARSKINSRMPSSRARTTNSYNTKQKIR